MRRVLVAFAIAGSFFIGLAVCAPRTALAQHRVNELTLASLRPGRDKYVAVVRKLGRPHNPQGYAIGDGPSAPQPYTWLQPCAGRELRIEFDAYRVMQTIDAEQLVGAAGSCLHKQGEPNVWATGHGVRIGDLKAKVISVYGKPGSVSPSTKDGRELELLYYAFDWAGPDVPQVMEITCERATGRVVEILLAFPSL